jgi:hypothetical protein
MPNPPKRIVELTKIIVRLERLLDEARTTDFRADVQFVLGLVRDVRARAISDAGQSLPN